MSKISRRDFMRYSGTGLAALGLSSPLKTLAQAGPQNLVIVEGGIAAAAKKAVEALGGISRFVKSGAKVLIKPNISFDTGVDRGANTTPELIAEVARMCVQAGAKEVMVTDCPLRSVDSCLKKSGVKEAMDSVKGANLEYITDERFFDDTAIPLGKDLKHSKIMRPLLDADVVINIPRAKHHNATVVTLGLKNLMGIAHDRKSYHSLHNLHQAIADLSTLVRPQLTIIDASNVMVDNGPGGPGTLVPLNIIVAGTNPVETDALMVSLSSWEGKKYKPEQIKHLKAASELGLGRLDLSQIKYERYKV